MENSGSKFSLTLTIIVLLIVLVGGYYVMMGGSAEQKPEDATPVATEDQMDSAEMAQLEADASVESGADDLDASLDGVDKEFGL